jgi:hypothetical protein
MQVFSLSSKTEMYRYSHTPVSKATEFLNVDILTDAADALSALLQLLIVNAPNVSLRPDWYLSSLGFSVPPHKNQDPSSNNCALSHLSKHAALSLKLKRVVLCYSN